MRISKIVSTAAIALSLIAVPTLASAAPVASKLALSDRAAPMVKGKKAAGGGLIIALLAGAAVIAGIIIAADEWQ